MSELCEICDKFTDHGCARCKFVFYCGKECQEKHWPEHQDECHDHDLIMGEIGHELEESEELEEIGMFGGKRGRLKAKRLKAQKRKLKRQKFRGKIKKWRAKAKARKAKKKLKKKKVLGGLSKKKARARGKKVGLSKGRKQGFAAGAATGVVAGGGL
jgi:hypothetical protein